MSSGSNPTTASVRDDRRKTYGDAKENHDNIGIQWTGLLQQHYGIKLPAVLPGHMVALMMTAMKSNRAATPLTFNPDNYLDGCAYFEIASEIDSRVSDKEASCPDES